ncbi:hypothetical protein C9374_006077 [Naegleria lovaniensis]|uniref:RNA-dependent RNA polymerase n=1 Tax=Naegleria lovaniensis TaxID=51637 RepID=A0AA88KJC8_NAELO|nr:uncharacterized protein C9374_006077 [Naegleria lovaniensis]KAG2381693.1 hypothetical protein C9374_006077 [Naegleria lovaniensis]
MNISSLDEIKDNFTSPIGDLLREHVSLTDLFIPELSNNIIKQTLAKLVGPCYPMVGTITLYSDKRYAYSSLYDGTKKDIANTSGFVFYSYNRLSRILMAMGLGRALIFVKFVNGNENNAELMDLKLKACNDGITYNDVHYTFFNASNSSLNTNDGSCVFLASCIERPYLISLLGNFEECAKQGVGKLIARIAMSNGKSYMSNEQLQKREIFMLQDEDEFPCADGCGMMREINLKEH